MVLRGEGPRRTRALRHCGQYGAFPMRLLFACAALAAGGLLSAQVSFFTGPASGFEVTQHDIVPPGGGNFSLPGGVAWDPAGPDFYFYDADTTVIRRFDTTLSAPATTPLLTVPNPVFGPYVDSMDFDPFTTTDLYFVESGAQVIHKARRLNADALDTTFGTGGIVTSTPYSFYPFDLEFDAFGRLFVIGSNGSTPESGVYMIDKSTLAATQVVDIYGPAGANFSGPIAFDASGNLHIGLPPATFGPTDPMRIVRFSKAKLDTAVNSGGATVLDMNDGTLVVDAADGFPTAGSMLFRTEGGAEVLYFVGTHTGDVYRSDISTRAYSVFAFGAAPPAGDVFFATALAAESRTSPFRPYSGDTTRMIVSMVHRDPTFVVLGHGLCEMTSLSSTTLITDLEITDAPGTIANGTAFRFQVELRDSTGGPVGDNAGIEAEVLSGSGTLSGSTYRIASNGVAIFDDLVLSGASGNVILRFSVAGGTGTADSAAINVAASNSSDTKSNGDSSGSGCTAAGSGGSWLALFVALGLLAAARLRRADA
jgi:hypothetical protein